MRPVKLTGCSHELSPQLLVEYSVVELSVVLIERVHALARAELLTLRRRSKVIVASRAAALWQRIALPLRRCDLLTTFFELLLPYDFVGDLPD